MSNQELWDKFELHLLNEAATKKRINKLHSMFNITSRELNLKTAKRPEIEKFINKLNKNEFKKDDGSNYGGSSKSDLKKFLRQFYKWYEGENEYFPKKVSWIRTKIAKDEKPEERPVVTREEILKLANSFIKPEYRMLILLLFDSGYRIEEMLSVRKNDLTWEQFDETQKCFWLSCNQSKTEKRKVDIPLFTEDVKTFCNSSYYQNLKDDDVLFDISYPYFTRKLKERGLELFNKPITSHCLRHSSATFYAREYAGDMILLANRYGWTYSSGQLKTYIRRSGASQRRAAKKVFSNELLILKEENQKLKERMDKIENYIKNIAKNEIKRKKL